ncbi:MAG: lysophospholipid acyltransferase family protein [Desulfobacterales bacterium]
MTNSASPCREERAGARKWLIWAHSALIYAWIAVGTLILGLATLAVSVFSRQGHMGHRVGQAWGRSILAVSGVSVVVSGLERLEPAKAYVFMANHQSNFDIPVLLGRLPVQFRWLAKAELFKIPLFGRAMRAAGYISIDRADRNAAFQSLGEAAEALRRGVSIMIFPEGTRSLDGALKPFKKGGFVMAINAGAAVVPVAIRGTYGIMPKSAWLMRPQDVTLEIGEPIASSAYTPDTKEALMERVREVLSRGFDGPTAGEARCSG